MVLAAGLGSRLRPLTHLLPKPLVPVGDRPALAHVLGRLAAAGIRRMVVNAHHGRDKLEEFLTAHAEYGAVALSVEAELLGTAGGVARAATLLGAGDVLIWNADILASIDAAALVAAHAGARSAATLVVQRRERGSGSVGLDPAGRVVRLRGERVADESVGGEFLGIHVLGEELRKVLPDRGCLVGDVYIPAMRRGAKLQAFASEDPFFDIGSVATYLEANLAWLAARQWPHWMGPGAELGPGVSLERTLLGPGAEARGLGVLDRCVVWPGASVEAPLSEAVVVPGRIVQVGPRRGVLSTSAPHEPR
jgi:mannose-1-phosphate guanylyltransferase